MLKKIFISLSFLCFFSANSQELLKEISRTFDNGQPMYIDYLEMEDLKKVKTEIYNESGSLIFSMQFDRFTGLPNGDFYDLKNKGSFNYGVLNCNDCLLVDNNKPSVFTYNHDKQNTLITKGNVINGRLVGKIDRYYISELTVEKIDWEESRRYVAAGADVGFRSIKTYKTGNFKKTLYPTRFYNSEGILDDGEILVNDNNSWNAKINIKDGLVESYISYDEHNIVIDSLSNNFKIWKRNYKYVKNDNFFLMSHPNEISPTRESIEQKIKIISNTNDYSSGVYTVRGAPLGLDNNGLYSIKKEGSFDNIIHYELYNEGYNDLNFKANDRKTYKKLNFFAIIYNLLVNDNDKLLEKGWRYDINYADGPRFQAIEAFVEVLRSDNWHENKNHSSTLRKNSFRGYLKSSNFYITQYINEFGRIINQVEYDILTKSEKQKLIADKTSIYGDFITIKDFFDNKISLTDYLRACKKSIDYKGTEITDLFVWDMVKNKYVLVDLDKLIDLSEKVNIGKNKYLTEADNIYDTKNYEYKFSELKTLPEDDDDNKYWWNSSIFKDWYKEYNINVVGSAYKKDVWQNTIYLFQFNESDGYQRFLDLRLRLHSNDAFQVLAWDDLSKKVMLKYK